MRKVLWFTLLVNTLSALAIEIDFSRAGMQVLSPDTIRLRNVRVAGNTYFGDFHWQGDGLVLIAAGEDKLPMFAITQRSYQNSSGVEPNLMQACMQEFGSFSRVADFQDLTAVSADNLSFETLLGMMEESQSARFFITYGRNLSREGQFPYFLSRETPDDGEAFEVMRLRGVLGLYAAKRPVDGRPICINVEPQKNPFFDW